ncbi:Ser/Thr phosphatase family protein [Streptomyces ipomoeae 91-03]|uniref:Ser/Thr phosphatase family protein n=1 Tax=Streptomyces ipomoeae 91-03 TaxID=698759 RepID=L1KQ51_9ACTN|nr:Ser/Thr phosphatase family protein [Streptomyces ipomoeae 91-03]
MARVPAALATLARRSRSHSRSTHPTAELVPRRRPWARALGLVAVVLIGAWLGLLIVGNVRTPVGPVNTTMTLRPSLTGGTKINVSPLGALELQSHNAPVRLDVNVDQLDPERAQALVDHPERLSGLQDEIASDVRRGTLDLAVRSGVAVVSGATALGLAVYRRPRRALAAGGLALTLLAASGGTAAATWNPNSVLEPKFSGLLSSAPSLVGNARSIVTEFDVYQKELARLVTNVTKLYDVTSTLPAYQPDPTTIRVLHVSDIHLNPASWKIISSLVEQYEINVIVDSGDTMDHGTAAENAFLDPIADLGAPYVWVRGNHDSRETQRYLEGLDNTYVLDEGKTVNVGGLRFAGMGDPQFTPDRSTDKSGLPSEEVAGKRLAEALRAQKAAGTPVDIAIAHNPDAARETDGEVPLPRPRRAPPSPRDGGPGPGYPPPYRGLDRRQRPTRPGRRVPRPHRGLGPLPRQRHPPAPGLGRDQARRPGPDDGRGQPSPPEGEPARSRADGRTGNRRIPQPHRQLAHSHRQLAHSHRPLPPPHEPLPQPWGSHALISHYGIRRNRFGDTSRHPICFSRPRRADEAPRRADSPHRLAA